jgi:gliding motility-associated-like protein
MNDFETIIKQKVEQFEVAFNEAHWAEMEEKLNAIRLIKTRKMVLISGLVITLIAATSYFIFSKNTSALMPPLSTNNSIATFSNTHEVKASSEIKTTELLDFTNSKAQANSKIAKADPRTPQEKKALIPIVTEGEKQEKSHTHLQRYEPRPVDKKINADFIVYNNKVCLGEEVNFESLEDNYTVSFTWEFGDGTTSHQKNPSHTYNESKVYAVSLTLLDRETGEEKKSTQHDIVTILENPKGEFIFSETSLAHDNNKLNYPYTTFLVNDLKKDHSYSWDYGNGISATSSFGKTIYKEPGEYTTTLIVKNNTNGCSITQKNQFTIQYGFDLFAPNAFTPNNNGGNETFIPKALLGWDTQFKMIILNQFGKTIFTSSDKNQPWNGKVNNTGQLLAEGTYLWQVTTSDIEHKTHLHFGKITLVK